MKQLNRQKTVIINAHSKQELRESGERLLAYQGKPLSIQDILKREREKVVESHEKQS